jgi:hypothetical protein
LLFWAVAAGTEQNCHSGKRQDLGGFHGWK